MQAHGTSVARISLTQNSDYESIVETAAGILVVMWRRQFASRSRAAVRDA
jgi:uncharacterized membrane protein